VNPSAPSPCIVETVDAMRILITSSRLPFALDMVRKLAARGHDVYASDSYEVAPGSHSRYLAGHFVTAAASADTEAFIADVERIVRDHEIELVVPAFEEAFYLATRHAELSESTTLFTAPFTTLARLHDKDRFTQLAERLGLPTPATAVARSDEELRQAIDRFPSYFARAAFSRGGVSLLTNTGPLAGKLEASDCHPSESSPWLVQEFVDGPMQCTYSTLHEGRVTAHCGYRAPRQWQHSTGIQFLSVDGARSLEVATRLGAELDYTGQMSLDFVDSPAGPVLIECNPRATDGVLLMSAGELERGLLDPDAQLTMVEPGRETKLSFAVVGQLFSEPPSELPTGIADLVRVKGSDRGWRDALPTMYSFLAFGHHARLGWRERKQVFVAMADGICWDGEEIAGMNAEDARFLAELEGGAPPA
jgi:glutathione synthase/RimK-type ligase-like ATP-grasp enzyme